ERAGFLRALAPAHRFWPGEGADHRGQELSDDINRSAAGFLDQCDVELALLGVLLDLGFTERVQPRAAQKALDRGIGGTDSRPFALFLQVGLARGNAVNGEREPP